MHGIPWDELYLRFAAYAPGVGACLVGTRRLLALVRAVRAVDSGPLPGDVGNAVVAAFAAKGAHWPSVT